MRPDKDGDGERDIHRRLRVDELLDLNRIARFFQGGAPARRRYIANQ
jgi:hypothetical protein